MVTTPDDDAYISPNGRLHLSRACAGSEVQVMSVGEAAGMHHPCGNCCSDSALTIIRNLAEAA